MEQDDGLFASLTWWNTVEAHAIPPGLDASFVTVRSAEHTLAVIPVIGNRTILGSLTTPYTCTFAPMMAAGLSQPCRIAVMAEFARFCRSAAVVRLDALPEEWDGLAALQMGARRAGLVPLRFAHFGNWFEDVSGLDWCAYLRRRPGALRETIRRRMRQAEKRTDARFQLFTGPEHMHEAAEAFESVYRRSWKDAEPYPDFNIALMQALAVSGHLRLGVWSIGATPVAVQLWVVNTGHAIVLKLAHDEAFKAHSPGTVLTALMLRHLLNTERVTQIDFGRGDDGYKQGWAMQRRQRIGLLLVNPWRPAGLLVLLRHGLGRIRASTRWRQV